MNYLDLLTPFNPWWEKRTEGFEKLPAFRRPVFEEIYKGIKELPQIISITGPRRVGKSTLIRQMIRQLLEEGISPNHLIYYSMDDPALFRTDIDHDQFFDFLMDMARKSSKKQRFYLFLDEIQRFSRWELFLKKYYDLDYPVRFTVSGSASSPIFQKSRESLLGRIKDYHLLPFSFREFLLFRLQKQPDLVKEISAVHEVGESVMGMLVGHLDYIERKGVSIPPLKTELKKHVNKELKNYLLEGGFPEVWSLPDWQSKQAYLFDNQVEKVISEDLVLAAEFRKPELLKRFYVSLLAVPGREINFQKLAKEIGINRANIEKYFPLLEMTDLVRHAEKFSKSPLRVRRGNIKCYLVDLTLRNAVLRLQEHLLEDPALLGLYAENLVFNALKKWKGTINISYYRERDTEVDFIVHTGAGTFSPIEVKYRDHFEEKDLRSLINFLRRFDLKQGIVVTKEERDFKQIEKTILCIPLPHFLMLFD
ncbi:MAG: ATP-binding protein [bacterium]